MTLNLTACMALRYKAMHSINKEEYKHPWGSGYGSVETCRNAVRVMRLRGHDGGGRVIGVGVYGNCSAKERKEDLSVCQRRGQEEKEKG